MKLTMWRAGVIVLAIVMVTIALQALSRARRTPGVQGGLGEVRTIVSAEKAYAGLNGGYFDTPACLGAPSQCVPGTPGSVPPFLDPSLARLEPRGGYEFRFEPGPFPSLDDAERGRVSKSSLTAFAVIAVPRTGGGRGRAFCGDSRGTFCARADGTMPEARDGRCPKSCPALQ